MATQLLVVVFCTHVFKYSRFLLRRLSPFVHYSVSNLKIFRLIPWFLDDVGDYGHFVACFFPMFFFSFYLLIIIVSEMSIIYSAL